MITADHFIEPFLTGVHFEYKSRIIRMSKTPGSLIGFRGLNISAQAANRAAQAVNKDCSGCEQGCSVSEQGCQVSEQGRPLCGLVCSVSKQGCGIVAVAAVRQEGYYDLTLVFRALCQLDRAVQGRA